jgi:hypothetical protein
MSRHRTDRLPTIRKFLDSDERVAIVDVEDGYRPQNVAYALQIAIKRNPYLVSRVEAFMHNGRVYLVRL